MADVILYYRATAERRCVLRWANAVSCYGQTFSSPALGWRAGRWVQRSCSAGRRVTAWRRLYCNSSSVFYLALAGLFPDERYSLKVPPAHLPVPPPACLCLCDGGLCALPCPSLSHLPSLFSFRKSLLYSSFPPCGIRLFCLDYQPRSSHILLPLFPFCHSSRLYAHLPAYRRFSPICGICSPRFCTGRQGIGTGVAYRLRATWFGSCRVLLYGVLAGAFSCSTVTICATLLSTWHVHLLCTRTGGCSVCGGWQDGALSQRSCITTTGFWFAQSAMDAFEDLYYAAA